MRKILITAAGGTAATNFIAGLRRTKRRFSIVGCGDDPWVLKKSNADVNYLTVSASDERYGQCLSRVVRREAADLVVPMTDTDVGAISRSVRQLGTRTFLPSPATLAMCEDKLRLAEHLKVRHVPVPASYPVTHLRSLGEIFTRLPSGGDGWCRMRRGAGSFGAAPVADARQARAWIHLWSKRRGVSPSAFMLAEFLPGRDFACQSLWRAGKLMLIKTTERLTYVDGAARLSGTSSVASLHKTVSEPRLVRVVRAAVLAVDRAATGAFSVDLKENSAGVPCVTEINAGRLLSGTTIFDATGRHNMSATYVRLGLGEAGRVKTIYDSPPGLYVSRSLDTTPHVFNSTNLWRGWRDARSF